MKCRWNEKRDWCKAVKRELIEWRAHPRFWHEVLAIFYFAGYAGGWGYLYIWLGLSDWIGVPIWIAFACLFCGQWSTNMIARGDIEKARVDAWVKAEEERYEAERKAEEERYEAEEKAEEERYEAERKAEDERFFAHMRALDERYEAERKAKEERRCSVFAQALRELED
jgi:hypothetical protein